ncbi:MAG: division/cell wall cluster transcriptional repressor MraZ [Patescibacteria group bacterium]
MFIGEYRHTLDTKGRLAIPVKFRNALERGAVVTKGIDRCLVLYPLKEWNALAERISQLPTSQADTRAFSRMTLASAMDVACDNQGRIIVPEYLRDYATMHKNVILAGLYNRIELWDEGVWQEYKTATEENSGDIAERLSTFGV